MTSAPNAHGFFRKMQVIRILCMEEAAIASLSENASNQKSQRGDYDKSRSTLQPFKCSKRAGSLAGRQRGRGPAEAKFFRGRKH